MTAHGHHPYQVLVYCGPQCPQPDGVTVMDVTPSEPTAEAVLEAITRSGLTPADLRSRTVFCLSDTSQEWVAAIALTYTALLGFAGRRLDLVVNDQLIELTSIDTLARANTDAGRPSHPLDFVQIGADAPPGQPAVAVEYIADPANVSMVRYARRIRWVAPTDGASALMQLVWIAGVRAHAGLDRLPYLSTGHELVDDPEPGICLDTLRKNAEVARRLLRTDDRDALVEPLAVTARQQRLLDAAAVPVTHTLTMLGASCDAAGELWHCPRPRRHTNGDATASMRVVRGKARCFRCDAERMDSLRMTMDALDVSADEAADVLLASIAPGAV